MKNLSGQIVVTNAVGQIVYKSPETLGDYYLGEINLAGVITHFRENITFLIAVLKGSLILVYLFYLLTWGCHKTRLGLLKLFYSKS